MKKTFFFLFCAIALLSIKTNAQLTNGLVGYWKLDGSAADATGVNNGSLVGTPPSATGKIGTAYTFAPSPNYYISIPNSTSLNIQTNTITLSAWAYSTNGGTQMIVSKIVAIGTHNNPYFQYNLQLLQQSTLYPRFLLTIGGTVYTAASSSVSINMNQWYHVAGTYDGTTMRLYVNGAQVATTAVTGNITGYTTPVYIAANGALGEKFIGTIDEVGIWNRTLTASEVTQLYNSGNGLTHPFGTTSAPSAPSGLTATASSCSQINLSWTDNSTNETGFYIYRGGSQITSVGAGVTSYSNTGLSASTAYPYYVVAYNASGNSNNSNTASATTPTCATIPVTSVTITPNPATVAAGSTVQLTATVLPANATNKTVTWIAMCDNTRLTVSQTGLVSAIGFSSYTGTIGADAINGVRGTTSVTIQIPQVPVTGVTLNTNNATLLMGSTLQLAATVAPSNATNKTVTWSSSNPAIATVSNTGLVAPVSTGTTNVIVTTNDGSMTATCAVVVNTPPTATWHLNGNNAYYSLGKVSIGTTIANSASALTVNGKILATEVEVVSSITSDYVFEPAYQLMPLTDLEIYLKQHKHLPGIPSVLEFKDKGQNLGEMQDMLLRKIEELTLYIIDQEKAIKELHEEISSFKKKGE